MGRRLLLAFVMMLPLFLMPVVSEGQASRSSTEGERTELAKDDITTLMVMVDRMPAAAQDRKMDTIWTNMAGSQTPRSDFLFCTGFAYLGNYQAQACLASAYESGRGVQKDAVNAYAWYSIALDNPINDAADKRKIQADRDRMRKALLTGTPARTEKDLESIVKAQRTLKIMCLAEIRNTGF